MEIVVSLYGRFVSLYVCTSPELVALLITDCTDS